MGPDGFIRSRLVPASVVLASVVLMWAVFDPIQSGLGLPEGSVFGPEWFASTPDRYWAVAPARFIGSSLASAGLVLLVGRLFPRSRGPRRVGVLMGTLVLARSMLAKDLWLPGLGDKVTFAGYWVAWAALPLLATLAPSRSISIDAAIDPLAEAAG